MQPQELREIIRSLGPKLEGLKGYLDAEGLKKKISEIDMELGSEGSWASLDKMQELQKTRARLTETLQPVLDIESKIEYLNQSSSVLEEEGGEMFIEDIQAETQTIIKKIEDMEVKALLSNPHDQSNAILTINSGAGGTESQDWAQMLFRMYLRWAENHGYAVKIVDSQPGEEAGIKNATATITGPYAYGYMKVEAGVHRLVRISPFDANKRRHTSFSAVLVFPEIEDDIDIKVNEDEIRVDTFRASGAGGQHVNKTSSAIRITHIPSGIVVSCQDDRSQHRNREMAMKILKSRLYDISQREKEKELQTMVGHKKEIAWGSQIRSYVLQPYRMVKDHRTSIESGNVDAILDGDIDQFINAALKQRVLSKLL